MESPRFPTEVIRQVAGGAMLVMAYTHIVPIFQDGARIDAASDSLAASYQEYADEHGFAPDEPPASKAFIEPGNDRIEATASLLGHGSFAVFYLAAASRVMPRRRDD